MKKQYVLFLSLSIIFITSFLFYNNDNSKTSEELWHEQFLRKKEKRKKAYSKADKPDFFTKHYKAISTKIGAKDSDYKQNYKQLELEKATKNISFLKSANENKKFKSVGPHNVGGRTRAIVIDPSDESKKTWFAASATGGIWLTKDGGDNWSNLSASLTNLSVNALVMSASNTDVMYAGTGESFPGGTSAKGNGVWKSSDRGITWLQLQFTANNEDFAYTNRLWVNPKNENHVLAATDAGIYKTTDAGLNWTSVLSNGNRVEDFASFNSSSDTLYAAVNTVGVYQTIDGGDTWHAKNKGMGNGRRYEIAVSPVNKHVIYASVDQSAGKSSLYISKNDADTWILYNSKTNLLGGQGEYDNCISGHPFNEDIVFVGGVNLWEIKLSKDLLSETDISEVTSENLDFISFVNFNADYYDGKLSADQGNSLSTTDWSSVEIRFGNNLKQKAHRFVVPSEATSGVKADAYVYKDYVEVPFQVWDITNNKQLMVSFRDQERDGEFNLYETTGKEYGKRGREYIFVNAIEYDKENPDLNIIKNGGHIYKCMYMLWPQLSETFTWDTDKLPKSKITIKYEEINKYKGELTCIGDAYGSNGGRNSYEQGLGFGKEKIPGLHPDHHSINVIATSDDTFTIVNGNDGGVAVSYDGGLNFSQKPNKYVTTQFYGVDKNPKHNQYIGGMQDNGTWISAENTDVNKQFTFEVGGDGFECLWHSKDENKILASVYFNSIKYTRNGGERWAESDGIAYEDGPFITRLSSSDKHPDIVFAISSKGLYKSTNFGMDWFATPKDRLWNEASSEHNVNVSVANPNVIWTGQKMSKDQESNIYVSKNEGESFTKVADYKLVDMNSNLSGIATHPSDESIAYLLFSVAKSPKILRTSDFGATWTDISGFGNKDTSDNGFPDVVVQSLIVMPHNPNVLWAGTEIGIFESVNNGKSWHKLVSNMPPVGIYQMKLRGNQVVIATHGRGIWTYHLNDYPNILSVVENKPFVLDVDININTICDSLELKLNNKTYKVYNDLTVGTNKLPVVLSESGNQEIQIISYTNDVAHPSQVFVFEMTKREPSISDLVESSHMIVDIKSIFAIAYDKLDVLLNDKIVKTFYNVSQGEFNTKIQIKNLAYNSISLKASLGDIVLSSKHYKFNIPNKKPVIDKLTLLDSKFVNVEYYLDFTYDKVEFYVNDKLVDNVNNPEMGDNYMNLLFESTHNVNVRLVAYSGVYKFNSEIINSSITTNISTIDATDVKVYPNPCSRFVNIDINAKYDSFLLELIDASGHVVSKEVLTNKGVNVLGLDKVSSGLYFLIFHLNDKPIIKKIQVVK